MDNTKQLNTIAALLSQIVANHDLQSTSGILWNQVLIQFLSIRNLD